MASDFERYVAAGGTLDKLTEILNETANAKVQLTLEERERSRQKKRKMRSKSKTFVNIPLYRAIHDLTVKLLQTIQQMPKKTVKITDIMLSQLSELTRWTASAYEQEELFLKHNSLCEAISICYVIKVCVNSASTVKLIGDSRHSQLTKSLDLILSQLVAWRNSIKGKGDDGME